MDNIMREQFVDKFSTLVSGTLGLEVASNIAPLLSEFLADYEISTRQTDLTIYKDYIPTWLDEYFVSKVVHGCKENSMKNYATHLKEFFEYIHLPADKITESDVQKYIAYCLRVKGNCKRTTDHKRVIINDFFAWSVHKKYLEYNPCTDIDTLHFARTNRTPYTDDEVTKIRNEVTNIRDKAIIETFISTACRVTELCRIKITDIDLIQGTVLLFGKGDKYRTVFVSSEMKHAILQYLKTRNDDCPYLFVSNIDSWKTHKREQLSKDNVELMMRKLSKKIGVSRIQPHRFRRYTATRMSNCGCGISDIQTYLGHTTPTVTAKYIYTDEENLKSLHKKYIR